MTELHSENKNHVNTAQYWAVFFIFAYLTINSLHHAII